MEKMLNNIFLKHRFHHLINTDIATDKIHIMRWWGGRISTSVNSEASGTTSVLHRCTNFKPSLCPQYNGIFRGREFEWI